MYNRDQLCSVRKTSGLANRSFPSVQSVIHFCLLLIRRAWPNGGASYTSVSP